MKHFCTGIGMFALLCTQPALAGLTYKLIKPVGLLVVVPTTETPQNPPTNAKLSFNESTRNFEAFSNTLIQKGFTLTNEGPDALTGLTLSTNKGEILSSTCSSSLQKNESCMITVRHMFTESNDISIVLSATGSAAGKAYSATSTVNIDHVPTMQGIQLQNASSLKVTSPVGTKASVSFNVYNPNPYEVDLTTPVFPAGAIGASTTCTNKLAAGATCAITLESTPVSISSVASYVELVATKLDGQSVVRPTVTVEGTDPYAGYLRGRFDFENGMTLNALPSGSPDFGMAGSGSATITTEPDGNKVLSLNGSSGIYNSKPAKSFTGDFTISFDVKFNVVGTVTSDDTPSNQYMFSMGGNDTRIQWYKRSDIGLRLMVGGVVIAQKFTDPVVGKWYHVSFTRKNNIMKFEWDGEVLATVNRPGPVGDPSSMSFGNYSWGGSLGVNGVMDNILIADYAM